MLIAMLIDGLEIKIKFVLHDDTFTSGSSVDRMNKVTAALECTTPLVDAD
jgi:hypothetical protein